MPSGFAQAATYVNCYPCNGGLIVPTFDDPKDREALAVLRPLFPDREIVPLPSREIILAGGNVHCVTQQQPAPVGS